MRVIFLIGLIQALFFSILIFNKKGKNISDKILGTWLLIFAIQLIIPFLIYSENYKDYIHLGGIDVPLIPLHAALLFIYTKSLMQKQDAFRFKWLIHIIPTIVTAICMLPYVLLSREHKIMLYENKMEVPDSLYILPFVMIIAIIYYIVRILKIIKVHKAEIHKEYSFEKDIDLKWIRNLVLTISTLTFLIIVGIIALKIKGLTLVQSDLILYSFLVLFVYAIGYWGYKQGKIFTYQFPKSDKTQITKKKTSKTSDQLSEVIGKEEQKFIERLQNYMLAEKPFVKNELTLYDLASMLGVSSPYLSQILNSQLQVNFYQYINRFRVEEVKHRIMHDDNNKYTLLSIAFESGFNSKASFNRIFKDITGMTPSQYKKSFAKNASI